MYARLVRRVPDAVRRFLKLIHDLEPHGKSRVSPVLLEPHGDEIAVLGQPVQEFERRFSAESRPDAQHLARELAGLGLSQVFDLFLETVAGPIRARARGCRPGADTTSPREREPSGAAA